MSKRSRQRGRHERRELERIDELEAEELESIAIIERKVGVDESRQPRFSQPQSIFSSVYRWALTAMAKEPAPNAPSRVWDAWYRAYTSKEPFLFGVLNGAVQIDQNRGWTLTGGRNQVARYTDILKGLDDGQGWREFVAWQAQSYYTAQIGFVAEVGRRGRGGPMQTLWSVDPCRCELTGQAETPLRYYPRQGGQQDWQADWFFRGKSLVNTDEGALGLGNPAVKRCYELAKIMVGVFSHYQQKIGIKTPDGILTGKYISESQWEEALRARNEALKADPQSYLNSLATIMSSGGDMPEFALTMLSSLPDRFDPEVWTLILMRGYALAFGYGAGEFYPESYGVVGRGKEQETQHESSTGKGGKDFILQMQLKLQQPDILPPTLEFTFDERDDEGEMKAAQVKLAKAQVITEMTKWASLSPEQINEIAAEEELIPEEWTATPDESTATDEEDADTTAEQAADMSQRVWRAMHAFPDEPIVRYHWPQDRVTILRTVRRETFYIPKVLRRTIGQVVKEYEDRLTNLVYNAWNKIKGGTKPATMQTALRTEHKRLINQLGPQSYGEGLREGGVSPDEMDKDDRRTIATWTADQLSFVNDFAKAVTEAGDDEAKRAAIIARVALWVESMRVIGSQGLMSAKSNKPGWWRLGATEKHCRTCSSLNGKRHRLSWYKARGLIPRQPGSETLECHGYNCDCTITDDDGNQLL